MGLGVLIWWDNLTSQQTWTKIRGIACHIGGPLGLGANLKSLSNIRVGMDEKYNGCQM